MHAATGPEPTQPRAARLHRQAQRDPRPARPAASGDTSPALPGQGFAASVTARQPSLMHARTRTCTGRRTG